MMDMHSNRPQEWTQTKLRTIGEACRAIKEKILRWLGEWICDKVMALHWATPEIRIVLRITQARL